MFSKNAGAGRDPSSLMVGARGASIAPDTKPKGHRRAVVKRVRTIGIIVSRADIGGGDKWYYYDRGYLLEILLD
jgi:hypothetical protein